MVQLQARAAGIDEVRTTDDVDALVDVMGTGVTVLFVASRLRDLGFEVVEPGWDDASAHRLRRGTDVVDLLVADTCPSTSGRSWRVVRCWRLRAAPRRSHGRNVSPSSTVTRTSSWPCLICSERLF